MLKYNKFLDFLKEDDTVEILNEGKQPLVGVFWLYNDEIIGDVRNPLDPNDVVDQKYPDNEILISGRKNHYGVWHIIVPEELKNESYKYLPRGRVMKLKKENKYIVFANGIMNDMKYRTKIKKYYNLLENNIIWNFEDDHYN